jgi:hypothetical protein
LTCTCRLLDMYMLMSRRKRRWTIASARQYLPKVIALAAHEPQAVYRRDKLVAGVVSAELEQKLEAAERARGGPSLAGDLKELRRLCAQDDYQLDVPKRADRMVGRKRR